MSGGDKERTGTLVHATCVSLDGAGVLLCGPPGAGKSDLALRLIGRGAVLIADDQTRLTAEDGVAVARAPASIRGRMEIRGIGIVSLQTMDAAPVRLWVDLAAAGHVTRHPGREQAEILPGIMVPRFSVDPREVSADLKVMVMAAALPGVTRME